MTVIPLERPVRDSRRPSTRTTPIRPVRPAPARTAGAPAPTTPAERAVTAAAALVDPIGLDELNALAELQTRVDRKYFVPADVFHRMIAQLADEMRVLDMDG